MEFDPAVGAGELASSCSLDGDESSTPLAIAHRGDAKHHRENTLAALSAAVAAGVDAIAVDVRFTRDAVPVLCHNRDLRVHLGCPEQIDQISLSKLRSLENEALGSAAELDRRIPTLDDALERLHGSVELMLDIKSDRSSAGIGNFREKALLSAIGDVSRVTVLSFDPWVLRRLRWLGCDHHMGIGYSRILTPDIDTFAHELVCTYLLIGFEHLRPEIVKGQRNCGRGVLVCNVDESGIDVALSAGVAGVLAPDPFALVNAIAQRSRGPWAA